MTDSQRTGSSPTRITCLVDNTASASSGFWAEHGLSFLIETKAATVLFDTGQSGEVLAHNQAILGKDLGQLSAVILSHGHYDHTGGLGYVLSVCPGVPLFGHPSLFGERFSNHDNESSRSVGLPFGRSEIESKCELRLTSEPVEVTPQIITSGEIPRTNGPEPRTHREVIRRGNRWEPDPLLDDQCVIVKTNRGLVVLLGCCHAGLVNTLVQVKRVCPGPLLAILGGTHLGNVDPETRRQCVAAFSGLDDLERVYAGHCTGAAGFLALSHTLGDRLQPCPAGLSLTF